MKAKETDTKPTGGTADASRAWHQFALAAVVVTALIAVYAGFIAKRDPLEIDSSAFSIFAGLYVATQAAERLVELVVAPWGVGRRNGRWYLGNPKRKAERSRYLANRMLFTGSVATVFGALASTALGLYLVSMLTTGGEDDDLFRTVDVFITALAIGGGTKALHGLIERISVKKPTEEEQDETEEEDAAATTGAALRPNASVTVPGRRGPAPGQPTA